MTNREWLLKTKLTIDGSYNFCETIGVVCTPIYGKPLCCECGVLKNWLDSTHETTADEDFAEIDIKQIQYIGDDKASKVIYCTTKERREYFEVHISPTETKIRITPQHEVVYVNLEDNLIRTIADKKRKEVWGNIHDKEVE